MQSSDSPLGQNQNANVEKQLYPITAKLQVAMLTSQALSYAKLEQQARQAALINQIVQAMRSTLVLDEVLQTTVEQLQEALDVSHCLVFRAGGNQVSEATDKRVSKIGDRTDFYRYYHSTLVQGEAVVIAEIESELALEESARACGIRSLLIVPLFYQKTYLGSISLDQCDRQREWTVDELTFVEAIAEHCAVAIHQCKLYQQAQTEISQREQEEEILLQTTSELLAIFQAFPDLYFRLDYNGRIRSYQAGQSADLYTSPDVFLGKRFKDILPPDVGYQLHEAFLQVLQTNSLVAVEYSLPSPKGIKSFEARFLPVLDHQVIVLVRDMTERQKALEALRESEERFRRLYEATFDAIAIHEDGKVIDANKALAATSGYEINELMGMNPLELIAEEARNVVLKNILAGNEDAYESIFLRKDGTTFPVEIQAKLINYQGRSVRVAVARDITQGQQTEELLKKQKEFLRQVIDTNPNLIFVKDWNGKFLLVNQAVANIYGTTVEDLIGKSDADLNSNQEEVERLLRDEREVMTTGIEKIIPEETVTDSTGKVRWYQTIKKPLLSPDGLERQVVGAITEITARKQAEIALQKANEELEIKVEERTKELRNAFKQLQQEVYERQAAETLVAGQKRVLEMIATGAALPDVLDGIARFVEEQSSEGLCAIALVDENGTKLLHAAAPSFPESYNQAVSGGIDIGPNIGSCGTAAYRKETVIVSDIATDPKWEHYKDLALSYGLRACWSTPIFATDGDVLGTFAVYYRIPRPPNLHERKLVEICTQLAGITIERQQEEEALRNSEERFRSLIETTSDWVWEMDENSVYTYVSPRIRDLLGYEPEEMVGKTPFALMLPEEASYLAKVFGSLTASQQSFSSLEKINLHKDGHEVILETSSIPFFDAEGKLQGYRGIDRDITERKRAEQALLQSENRLRTIIDAEPECVKLVASDGTILEINTAGLAMIEAESAEAVIGQSVNSFITPEYQEAYQALNQSVCQGNQGILEFEIIGYKSTHRWLETHAVPLYNDSDGKLIMLAIARDITERKRAEDALKDSEVKFRNLVEQTNDWVWECDRHNIFTYVNPKVPDILGYKPEDVLGKTNFDFMSSDEAKRFSLVLENFTSQQQPFSNVEKTLIHKKGHLVVLETSGTPVFDHQGVLQGYRGITRDITERKQVEQEIRKALTKEKELSELKSRFVTMTSHEFRTPLSTILSSAELIEHYGYKFTEEKKLNHLHRIQIAVQHMIQLLNDVLIIGKAEAGKLELNPAPMDLHKFCRDLVEEMQLSAGTQYTVTFVSQGECNQTYMDEKLLRHIFNNLLSNAIKYSPQGGTIRFELACLEGEATFQVQDQGIGIPPEDQQQLFDSFHRATNVGTIPGTGLGLAIAKNCVDLHGGEIRVQSEVGSGTTFKVILPLNYPIREKTQTED